MAKVLVYTSPARGHLYPITPTLDELRRRGHDVALRTLASQVATMRTRGFDAAPISAAIEAIEHDDYRARTPGALSSVPSLCLHGGRSTRFQISRLRLRRSGLTCSSSMVRHGVASRVRRRGAGPGRVGFPIRCHFPRRRFRPSDPACPRRADPRAGCAIGCFDPS